MSCRRRPDDVFGIGGDGDLFKSAGSRAIDDHLGARHVAFVERAAPVDAGVGQLAGRRDLEHCGGPRLGRDGGRIGQALPSLGESDRQKRSGELSSIERPQLARSTETDQDRARPTWRDSRSRRYCQGAPCHRADRRSSAVWGRPADCGASAECGGSPARALCPLPTAQPGAVCRLLPATGAPISKRIATCLLAGGPSALRDPRKRGCPQEVRAKTHGTLYFSPPGGACHYFLSCG